MDTAHFEGTLSLPLRLIGLLCPQEGPPIRSRKMRQGITCWQECDIGMFPFKFKTLQRHLEAYATRDFHSSRRGATLP